MVDKKKIEKNPKADKEMGIHDRLVFIQKNLKAPKNQYNDFSKFHYRSCEDILEAIKPLLGECSLTLSDEIVQYGNEKDIRFYVKATAKLSRGTQGDVIENTAYARESFDKKGMDDSQITGAASSYARKYALNGLFAIDDTGDADTMDNTQGVNKPARSQEGLMKNVGMDTKQKAPKCPNCGADMRLFPRKDNPQILFWGCANWRTKGCKDTFNVDDVDIDGNMTLKPESKEKASEKPKTSVKTESPSANGDAEVTDEDMGKIDKDSDEDDVEDIPF